MGGSVSINNKSSKRIELSWFSQQFLVIWPDTTHQPTHPPNYIPTHSWRSLHRFQILKQNWNISISSGAIEFWVIPGVPSREVWVGGWGWGVVRGCTLPTCTHMHACTQMRMHVWHHREFPGIPLMGAAICMKLSCLPHMHVRACMRMCVHLCGGHPQPSPHHINTPPLPSTHPHPTYIHPPTTPKSHREPKMPKFNNSCTNRDNSILFEDSLPLNIPELIKTIVDHPRYPHPPAPPPEPQKPKSEELQ